MVQIVVEPLVSFALWGSDAADCFDGFTVGVWLCLSLGLRCQCCSELSNLVTEG